MKHNQIGLYLSITCTTLVASVVFVLIMNVLATAYLRAYPEILMSYADRVNENTRAVREKMIPADKVAEWYDLDSTDEVKWMWDEFYNTNPKFESYTHYRHDVFIGKYYGSTQAGYRMTRDSGPWPPNSDHFNVFFFGGSTAFGVGPFWATVASYLQDLMNDSGAFDRNVYVYNFGRSGYMSSQEQVLFHRLISAGHIPNMVVFLDGLNDFCWVDGNPSGWTALARYFEETNAAYKRAAAGYGVVTKWELAKEFFDTMPVLRLINAWWSRVIEKEIPEYVGPEQAVEETPESETALIAIIERYLGNIRQVEAVSKEFGITPVFVWQPIPTYKYDVRFHLFYPSRLGCHINSKEGYPIMAEMVSKELPNEHFVWAADIQDELNESLYIDAFHYTAPMSKRLASFISDAIFQKDSPVDERDLRANLSNNG